MPTARKMLSYTVAYKLHGINSAKEHGNRAAARYFGSPPTEKNDVTEK